MDVYYKEIEDELQLEFYKKCEILKASDNCITDVLVRVENGRDKQWVRFTKKDRVAYILAILAETFCEKYESKYLGKEEPLSELAVMDELLTHFRVKALTYELKNDREGAEGLFYSKYIIYKKFYIEAKSKCLLYKTSRNFWRAGFIAVVCVELLKMILEIWTK
jgi:hypothetical protein